MSTCPATHQVRDGIYDVQLACELDEGHDGPHVQVDDDDGDIWTFEEGAEIDEDGVAVDTMFVDRQPAT